MFKLDKMEIQGFKSFYGRAQFEFRSGITAVVGPNGCGKSNVGDAIAWVLGDQSPRSLRADRMEDVIFNGSEKRKPVGMAEVTLRFEGRNGGPDPTEEFIVTRRLYRSGESEYSLNGTRCRLKDIQERLTRSRVGSRLYSVIEQGKVDQIISAKPKDRRTLFEEAAGILGYKSKRRIALGKLEATQGNLVRIHDILAEVEKQTNSLRRQVARARRYQRLQDRIRERRGALLQARLVGLEKEAETAAARRRELGDHEAERGAALGRCEAEMESLRRRSEAVETEARRYRDRVNELDRALDRDRMQMERSREQLVESREAVERWNGEAGEIRIRLRQREGKGAERRRWLEEVQKTFWALEAELGQKEEAQRARVQAVEAGEAAAEALRRSLLEGLDRLAEDRNRAQRVADELRRLAERKRELAAELAEAHGDAERLRVEREELDALVVSGEQEAHRVRREREEAERSLAETNRFLQENAEARENLAATLAQLEERLRVRDESERSGGAEENGIEAILSAARDGKVRVRGRVADGLDVAPDWEAAAEGALREFLGAVVVAEPFEALAGVQYLRARGAGRCAFLPAAGPPRSSHPVPPELLAEGSCLGTLANRVRASDGTNRALQAVLEGTLVAPSLEVALDLHRRYPGWRFVTPEGDLVRPSGLVQGGAPGSGEKGPLARRRIREEDEVHLRSARGERDRLEADRQRREEMRRDLGRRVSELEERIRERDRHLVEARLRLAQREEDRERVERTLRVANDERIRLEADEVSLTAEQNRLAEALSVAESHRHAREEQIGVAAVSLCSRREEMAVGSEELGAFRSRVAVERQQIASREEELGGLDQAVREERERLARAESEARGAAERVESLEQSVAGLTIALERGQAERGQASNRSEKTEAEVVGVKTDLLPAEQRAKAARASLDELRSRIAEAEVIAARLSVELQHLEASCREELGMGLEELRALPAPEGVADLPELEREMAELKSRLERVGAVNLVALEQYREMEDRRAFLSRQKKDLEESIESLNDTIRKINRTSREKFLEAFEKIQQEFDRSFRILFGGGQAELRLMEEEDVLECGIEIIASPPGKRLQNISLLSGGEKALTAVALLFALFRCRPSPFCVLDEVDAPLDEANVTRFTRLLRDLTPETQFILITHNRRSMEAADLLYGITMEEPGISKVVSVRMEN